MPLKPPIDRPGVSCVKFYPVPKTLMGNSRPPSMTQRTNHKGVIGPTPFAGFPHWVRFAGCGVCLAECASGSQMNFYKGRSSKQTPWCVAGPWPNCFHSVGFLFKKRAMEPLGEKRVFVKFLFQTFQRSEFFIELAGTK